MLIELDGALGEGGGQILRSALSLSMCTGFPVRLKNIRAKRKKPGLMRQHLTAVHAAAAVSGADIDGASLGSTRLSFKPSFVKGGDYRFSIGTAGSCTLVLQTILPALLMATQDSHVVINGGTHNAMSPPFHFLQRAFLPLLMRMGAKVALRLIRFGFYPTGGGEISIDVKAGTTLLPLHLESRGKQVNAYAESFYAGLPSHIAERELALVKRHMLWHDDQLFICELDRYQGPGNALLITLTYEQLTEVFTGFGEKGVPAETVANRAVNAACNYMTSDATVDPYLADQLLLPMALAGGGSFITTDWSLHAATNADIIRHFLPIAIQTEKMKSGAVRVELSAKC